MLLDPMPGMQTLHVPALLMTWVLSGMSAKGGHLKMTICKSPGFTKTKMLD
jgi:hypothetical protein